jgi:hypothetical protein
MFIPQPLACFAHVPWPTGVSGFPYVARDADQRTFALALALSLSLSLSDNGLRRTSPFPLSFAYRKSLALS